MSNDSEKSEIVPCFDSIESFQEAMEAKKSYNRANLYPRHGSEKLFDAEKNISNLVGSEAKNTVVFSNGMSAVTNSIDIGLARSKRTTPVLAAAKICFPESDSYFEDILPTRNTKVVRFDGGSIQEIKNTIDKYKPDVIFSETIGNGPGVPVLDINGFLKILKKLDYKPTVVLDNTLPLSTGLPLYTSLAKNDNIIVVESGTKSYTFNKQLLGIAYSKSPDLTLSLRRYSRVRGCMPGVAGLKKIQELLPKTKKEFDERNLKIFKTNKRLAEILYKAQQDGADFHVDHPSLPTQKNHNLTKNMPFAASPVLFLNCKGAKDQFGLAQQMWNSAKVREYSDIGQSFGFDRTRILPLPPSRGKAVRIAAGANTDPEKLGNAIIHASSKH